MLLTFWGLAGASLISGQIPPLGQVSPSATGTVTGHVRGPGDAAVPGATIQLTDPKSGERRETWTDLAGDYTFTGLAPADYRLDVSLVGFRPDSRQPLPITADKSLRVNIALIFASPEGTSLDESQAAKHSTGNHGEAAGSRNPQGANPSGNSASNENPRGPGASLRIAEGNGAGGQPPAEAQVDEADNSTSANNSFLLGRRHR